MASFYSTKWEEKKFLLSFLTKIKSTPALNKNNNNIQEQQEQTGRGRENCTNEMVGKENDGVVVVSWTERRLNETRKFILSFGTTNNVSQSYWLVSQNKWKSLDLLANAFLKALDSHNCFLKGYNFNKGKFHPVPISFLRKKIAICPKRLDWTVIFWSQSV